MVSKYGRFYIMKVFKELLEEMKVLGGQMYLHL
jgi:hypothetical protein